MFKVITFAVLIVSALAQQPIRLVSLGQSGQNLQSLGGNGQIVLLLQGNQLQAQPQPQPQRARLVQVRPAAQPVAISSAAAEPEGPPRPYDFEYSTTDESGTTTSRRESSDGRTVTGSYSYLDADGVSRVVDYTADENGYRANVRTNEPGTAKNTEGDPADTEWDVQPPPQGVVERYANVQALAPQPQPRIAVVQTRPQPQPRIIVQQQPRQQQFVLVPADQLQGLQGLQGGLGGIRLATTGSVASASGGQPQILLLNGLRRK